MMDISNFNYGDFMLDPMSGLNIPKSLAGNLAWRKQLLSQANKSNSVRGMLRKAAATSPIFWLNAFGWTYLQKSINSTGVEENVMGEASHVPFITWKIQDEAMVSLHESITRGIPVLIRKSRDMGASWIVVAMFQWFWQFRPSTSFMEISRKESLVDRRGDMDSLFEKHRYLLRWQPEWLRPSKIKDQRLLLENLDIVTAIVGESTNENAGQASRKTAILLDEFGRVPNGEEIDLATADTSACRIFLSTPQGPNTAYARIGRAMRSGTRAGKIIEFMWYRHPEKGRGLETATDEKAVTRPFTSPWLRNQLKLRPSKNVAMNIWAEDGESGDLFFDSLELDRHAKRHVVPPEQVGKLLPLDGDMGDETKKDIVAKKRHQDFIFIRGGEKGPWRLWLSLIDGRPSQDTRYVFGVDISAGTGSSNSVITVLDNNTNMIVAKYWAATTSPEDLAEAAVFAAVWFGGKDLPLLIWEKNGPGMIFGKKVLALGYPKIWFDEVQDQKNSTPSVRWGWHSSSAKKEMLLGAYREALYRDTVINPCLVALNEARDYSYNDKGQLEPGISGSEQGGGRALHGDHVIADALVTLGRLRLPSQEKEVPIRPPHGSFAARRLEAKRKARRLNQFV